MEAGRNATRSHSFEMVAFVYESDLSPDGRLLRQKVFNASVQHAPCGV
jgi:hypothetical protein